MSIFTIRKFRPTDHDKVISLTIRAFSHLMQPNEIVEYIYSVVNFDKSFVAEDASGELIGLSLFGDRQLADGISSEGVNDKIYIDLKEYENKTGIEHVALVVREGRRGTGLGTAFKNHPKPEDADYLWGVQYKELNNLEHWLKRRKLVAENKEFTVTVEDLKRSETYFETLDVTEQKNIKKSILRFFDSSFSSNLSVSDAVKFISWFKDGRYSWHNNGYYKGGMSVSHTRTDEQIYNKFLDENV